MGVTRVSWLGGPAAVSWNGHVFWAREGVVVAPALELAAVNSDANGVLDETVFDTPVTIRFTPAAKAADLAALFPHLQGARGGSLFGAGDVPLVLTAANGVRLTFAAVALTQMPDLDLGVRGAAAGTVTFLARGGRGAATTAANRLVTIDTATLPAEPGSSPQLSDDYVLRWGAGPWGALRAREGFRVRFALETTPVLSDANALLDVTLERLAVEVRFVPGSPNGPAEGDVIGALQLQGVAPGRGLAAGAAPLTITGDALAVTLPEAQLAGGGLAFAAGRGRVGEVVFVAERAFVETAEALAELRA